MSKFLRKVIYLSTFLLLFFTLLPSSVSAQASNSFINVVMPVRGKDFWEKEISPEESFLNYYNMIKQKNIPATYLLRFDALNQEKIVNQLKALSEGEVGLFLEVTPSSAESSGVKYHPSRNWHQAESILLTGYGSDERIKIIDSYFEKFKKEFGYFPKTVGAWWIDGASLSYMKKRYGILVNLSVADQFSTDGYQVWGQYFSTPFYPSRFNASQVAQNVENKIGTVQIQWAARDPFNGYGNAVEDSTFSVQANDYLLHPGLDINYFSKLLDIYLNENKNPFAQITIGIENNFSKKEHLEEFSRQLDNIRQRQIKGEVRITTAQEFGSWYTQHFPTLSPSKILISQNPLNESQSVLWYLNSTYRTGIFLTHNGLIIRDLRLYSDTMEEPCLKSACKNLDLARTTSKPLDDVTFKQHLVVEESSISNYKINQDNMVVTLNYKTSLGKEGNLILAKNDFIINGQPKTIAGLIIENTTTADKGVKEIKKIGSLNPILDFVYSLKSVISFILAVLFLFTLPGRFFLRIFLKDLSFYEEALLGTGLGLGIFIFLAYISLLLKLSWFVFLSAIILSVLSLMQRSKLKINFSLSFPLVALSLGIVISVLPVIKSGLIYPYGMGFWGPNGHDAIWHLSVIESLSKELPPQNFAFSQMTLTNYHYFFDLFLSSLSKLPYLDKISLYFRLWPIFVSILIGGHLWILGNKLKLGSSSAAFLILLTFLAGSFGWIISFIRQGDFGGESMFWANQAISLHLNPPFALSVLILLCGVILLTFNEMNNKAWIFSALLFGLLWGIKAYAGVLVLASLALLAFYYYFRYHKFNQLRLFGATVIFSAIVFLPLNAHSTNIFEFSPFWLINSMIDSPDRFGWTKLSNAIFVYSHQPNYLKLFLAEGLGLIIFLIGNLGLRSLGFPLTVKYIFSKNYPLAVISVIGILAIFPAVLFIQKGNPWNIVQFFYYTMLSSTILSALVFDRISKKFSPAKSKLFVILLIIFSAMTSYSTLKHYFPNNSHAFISFAELDALKFLKQQPVGIVLTQPYDEKIKDQYSSPLPLFSYVPSSYVSAFAAKPIFISDEINLDIIGVDYHQRLIEEKEFFKNPNSNWSKKFLKDANISYIYSLKNQNFNSDNINIKKIFENSEVEIFKVN